MSKKMPKGKPFQKGQSGNPGGRAKLPDDIKEARKLNQIELERIVNKYLWLDREKVQEAIRAPGTPMMELMVASIVALAAQKGDQQRLDFVLNRLIGKVTEKIKMEVEPFVVTDEHGKPQVTVGMKETQE